jgi:hypothetical protein
MARDGYDAARGMLDRAEALLSERGYVASQSSLGDARYYSLPGSPVRIRVATYHHRHDATVDLVITPRDARERVFLSDAELVAEVDRVIAEAAHMAEQMAEDEDEDGVLAELRSMSDADVRRRLRGE